MTLHSVEYMMFEWMPVEIYNVEIEEYEKSALLKEITRSISRALLFCIEFIREILVGGVKTIVAFTSWDYVRTPPTRISRINSIQKRDAG